MAIHGPVGLFEAVTDAGRKGVTLQRYKGLGEMNPDQLWETTLDINARSLLQVKIKEVDEADDIFDQADGRRGRAAPRIHPGQCAQRDGRRLDIVHGISREPIARPMATAPTNSARKMPNRILAMAVAAAATPVKPNRPATMAISTKTTAHLQHGCALRAIASLKRAKPTRGSTTARPTPPAPCVDRVGANGRHRRGRENRRAAS